MLPPVSRKYIDFMTHRFIKGLIMFLIGCMILLLPILVNLGDIVGVPIIIGSMIAIIGFLIMLVADFNGKLNKLQVKTSEIDYFVVYNLASDTLLMLPIKEFEGRNAVSFRIPYVETHNQHKSLNYEDYLFDKIVNV